MSEETGINLSNIIEKLEKTEISELQKIAGVLKSIHTEIASFNDKSVSSFMINYGGGELRIYGFFSQCPYYITTIDVHDKLTLAEIFERFFNDPQTFYRSVLSCINGEVARLITAIEGALPNEDDP